jgi:GNAT superfamily N-acetyltransferase
MFELTQELIDDIIFWMEDQNGEFVIDVQVGTVVNVGEFGVANEVDGTEDRYINLPEWDSADGFGLMENFTASLKNPPARKQLSAALNRGRGVFRAFKDALAEFPEVEKLWFAYKDKEMHKAVHTWYAALCEEAGVRKIGEEPEETDELVSEDFQFFVQEESAEIRITARNSLDKQAGRIFAGIDNGGLVVQELFVEEPFRGLGLGKALLKRLLAVRETAAVTIDIPAESEAFSRVLLRENFMPQMTRFKRAGCV